MFNVWVNSMLINSFYTTPVSRIKMRGEDGNPSTTTEQKNATASQFATDFQNAEKKRQAYSKELQTILRNNPEFQRICNDLGLNIKAEAQKKADQLASEQVHLPKLPGFDYHVSFEKLERRY
jgi:hypothetical protein